MDYNRTIPKDIVRAYTSVDLERDLNGRHSANALLRQQSAMLRFKKPVRKSAPVVSKPALSPSSLANLASMQRTRKV